MYFWRLKYLLLHDQKSFKLTSIFFFFVTISFLYLIIICFFEKDCLSIWNADNDFSNRFISKDKIFNFIPFEKNNNYNSKKRIAIVMIVTNDTRTENYDHAIKSVHCYSLIHDYEFVLAVDSDFNCPHEDKFFRRHCAAAKILPLYDAILFLDADIGVVNPHRKIEEFMDEGVDVTFYDRFYNWEIMAGSYIAKNTQYAVDLLNDFADYEFKLPKSFHGTDNGALHIFLAEKLFPGAQIEISLCETAYNKSQSFEDLFTYEACIRAIYGVGTKFGKVKIMKKGTGWARDGWLTSMLWSPELDFMFHGWKTGQLKERPNVKLEPSQMGRSQWFNPLNGAIHLNKCGPKNSTWSYDTELIVDKDRILKSLRRFEREVAIQQVHSYSRMTEMLLR